MSSTGSPRSSTLLDPTRQQLDELDALLNSMLALPVNRLDSEVDMPVSPRSAPAASVPRPAVHPPEPSQPAALVTRPAKADLHSAPSEPQPEQLVAPAKAENPIGSELSPSAKASSTRKEKVQAPEQRPEENVRKQGKRSTRDEGTPSCDRPMMRKPVPSPGVVRDSRAALWLYPLIWINGLFDLSTRLLGDPGRWLRRPRSRNLLGWTGLLLLVTALVILILDQIGWKW